MRCKTCHKDTRVVDSRESGDTIRRRRECINCNQRFTTRETVEVLHAAVLKRNGITEPFDRTKLLNGMIKACEKLNVPQEQIETAAAEIEARLMKSEAEITSKKVGQLVLEKLNQINPVAYIRFKSVHKGYKDVSQIAADVAKLKNNASPKSNGGRAKKPAQALV